MKKILFIFAVCASFVSTAQNLESKIPSTAEAVVSVNGSNLLDLVSVSEFNDYSFAKKLFKEFNRKSTDNKVTSIEDVGFDLNSKAYYFYKATDSINYHTFMIKLTDRNKFESIIPENDKKKIEREGSMNSMAESSAYTMWNDNMLVFAAGDRSYRYFRDNEERFKKMAEDDSESYYRTKKKITQKWTKAHIMSIYNTTSRNSITTNKSYLDSKDKNAEASAWVKNYGGLIGNAMDLYRLTGIAGTGVNSSLYGFKSVVANMYLEEDGMRMSTEMEVSGEWQKIFKKMYKSKMNSNFFKYFNQNEALAYMSFSMDMQAVFEEYPTMMSKIYGGMMPDAREEIQVGTELLSMLLDEETIGELVTGDMLFVLNDFGEKEVSYTSYEYDEDYNRKKVEKTKTEVLPDFTIMIGSEKGDFLTKVALLGKKHKLIQTKAGYFKVKAPKSEIPFDVFTAVKNDILFFATSEDKISKIVNGTYNSNPGVHQKLIKNNISAAYVNGQQILTKIPADELRGEEKRIYEFAQQNFKDAYFKSSRMKGNKMHSEIKINTNSSKGNSLKMLFDFMEVLAH